MRFSRRLNRTTESQPRCHSAVGGNGGEGGIRTHGPLARSTVFETAPFDHSGTSPQDIPRLSMENVDEQPHYPGSGFRRAKREVREQSPAELCVVQAGGVRPRSATTQNPNSSETILEGIRCMRFSRRLNRTTESQPRRHSAAGGDGGEGGIRTHGRGLPYTRFPVVHLRPLGHLSSNSKTLPCSEALLRQADGSGNRSGLFIDVSKIRCGVPLAFLAKPPEEVSQDGAALLFQHPGRDGQAVVEPLVGDQVSE